MSAGNLWLERRLDIGAVRAAFPYLAQAVYLNTASTGLSWLGQGAAAARFYDDKARGHEGRSGWRVELEWTQRALGELLRVDTDEISFMGSASEALNLIAHAIPLEAGDQVLICEDEFPAVVLAWSPAALRGAELIRAQVAEEHCRTEALVARISQRTRVVCVSHVHWCTGTRVDLESIARACRREESGGRLHIYRSNTR